MFRSLYFVCFTFYVLTSEGLSLDFEKAYTNIPKLGELYGHHKNSSKGRQYVAFEGIPYALPPVGKLRFEVLNIFIFI